jgi:hypothetical protein
MDSHFVFVVWNLQPTSFDGPVTVADNSQCLLRQNYSGFEVLTGVLTKCYIFWADILLFLFDPDDGSYLLLWTLQEIERIILYILY